MRKDKEEIFALRREGKSYREIMELVPISKSTLCAWFKPCIDLTLLKERKILGASLANPARMLKMQEALAQKRAAHYAEAKREAIEEFVRFKNEVIFVAGLCLYWGEGDKNAKYPIRIANVEPAILRIFLKFLRKYCAADNTDIRVSVLLYPDLDLERCIEYWSSELALGRQHFHKPQVIEGRHKTRRLAHGVGSVVLSNKYVKIKLLEWIRLLGEKEATLDADIV